MVVDKGECETRETWKRCVGVKDCIWDGLAILDIEVKVGELIMDDGT